ncbi:MAG TPA: PAS domain S-box protein [Dehalococcoidia bacterium]|nr:PAS domain S-box protein [Dehalococcoidia bacterium]
MSLVHEASVDVALRGVLEKLQTGILVRDDQGSFILVNDALCDLLGRSRGELLGRSDITAFIHPDEHAEALERERTRTDGDALTTDTATRRLVRSDGSECRVQVARQPLRLNDGSSGVLLEIRDISNEFAAHSALQERDERLRSVFEDSLTPMSFVDIRTRESIRNRAFASMLGYSLEEFSELPREAMLSPEDLRDAVQRVESIIGGGPSDREAFPRSYIHKDGHLVDTLVQTAPLSIDRERVGVLISLRDVTAEHAALLELTETAERFRAVFEDSLTPLVLMDPRTNEIARNRAFADMLGYPADEISELPREAFVLPEDESKTEQRLADYFASGELEPNPFPRRYTHRDGHMVDVIVQSSPLTVAGKRAGALASLRDVTSELAAQEALRESEERFRAVFEDSVTPMWLFDDRTGEVRRNRAYATMLGYSVEELSALPAAALVRPEDLPEALRRYQDLTDGRVLESELATGHYVHRDGHVIDVVFQQSPLDIGEERLGVLVAIRDVTAEHATARVLQEKEEHYRALFESAQVGNVVVGRDHKVRFANEAAARLLRYEREDLIGRPYTDLVHEGERESVESNLDAVFAGELTDTAGGRTRRFLRADGATATVHSTSSLYREDGEVTGIHVDWTDVTELLRLRDERLQSQKLEAVGTLVSGVAHDFNNLLTSIGGSIELETTARGSSAWLGRAAVATARASELVQQLLRFSKRADSNRRTVDLGELAEETVTMVREMSDRRIAIRVEKPGVATPILADHAQVQQVLMNLVINACDAVAERLGDSALEAGYEPRVTVTLGQADEQDPTIGSEAGPPMELRVADNGIGMSPEVRARMFDPFFTTKDVDQGTGLGLSTVYGIVSDHDGSITVESIPGKGSAFVVRFPTLSVDRRLPGDAERAGEVTEGRGAGARVLVVDDEVVIGEILDGVLGAEGYDVVCAVGGREGLRLADDQPFDLVLLDINMPGIDGWEVLAELHRKNADLPVIMVSGYAQQAEAEERGARALIQKPFDSSELLSAVSEHIHA